jgi:hypothetical protein
MNVSSARAFTKSKKIVIVWREEHPLYRISCRCEPPHLFFGGVAISPTVWRLLTCTPVGHRDDVRAGASIVADAEGAQSGALLAKTFSDFEKALTAQRWQMNF